MEIRASLGGIRIEELDDPTYLENERSKPIETMVSVWFSFQLPTIVH
jgi:hypothetical protein